MDLQTTKQAIAKEVDALQAEMADIAAKIHAKPELGFQEFYASGLHTEFLKKYGADRFRLLLEHRSPTLYALVAGAAGRKSHV